MTGSSNGGQDGDGIVTILGLQSPYYYFGGSFSGPLFVEGQCTYGMPCQLTSTISGTHPNVCAAFGGFCDDPATLVGFLSLTWTLTTTTPVTGPNWTGTANGTFSGTLIGYDNPGCLSAPGATIAICTPPPDIEFSGSATSNNFSSFQQGTTFDLFADVSFSGTATPIPESSTLFLLGAGALAVLLKSRIR